MLNNAWKVHCKSSPSPPSSPSHSCSQLGPSPRNIGTSYAGNSQIRQSRLPPPLRTAHPQGFTLPGHLRCKIVPEYRHTTAPHSALPSGGHRICRDYGIGVEIGGVFDAEWSHSFGVRQFRASKLRPMLPGLSLQLTPMITSPIMT